MTSLMIYLYISYITGGFLLAEIAEQAPTGFLVFIWLWAPIWFPVVVCSALAVVITRIFNEGPRHETKSLSTRDGGEVTP
jgi:hypothetical protein